MTRKDSRPLLFLFILLLIQFAPVLFTGRTYFLGDLTYFYHPWHALSEQMLESGLLPLWNPYGYMGMPLLGSIQTGTFAPGTLPFHFFPFPIAYKLHLLIHHALAAFFAYLWLRRLSGRAGAAAGAAVFAIGGILLGKLWIINQTAVLVWLPAFFLFARSPALLGLAMAASLLAGYPQMWAGMLLAALTLPWAGRTRWKPLLLGAALALGLCACMLLPGLETVAHSNRGGGLAPEQSTSLSLKAGDLPSLVSPAFIREKDASGLKYPIWKTLYLGFAATALAVLGLALLKRQKAVAAASFIAAVSLFMMGSENPLSAWLWTHLPPLHFIRYPANLSYLLLAALIPLVALGLRRRRWAAGACVFVAMELLFYGFRLQPTISDRYFSDPGPLVQHLQGNLSGHRFAASPKTALLLRGKGDTAEAVYFDVKHRLYGSSNLPYRLAGTTGLGESLLLAPSYRVMDHIFTRPNAEEALALLPWLDTKFLLTKEKQPGVDRPHKEVLWNLIETEGPARARFVPETSGEMLEGTLSRAPELQDTTPFFYAEPREDRFRVTGNAPGPGWVFIANAWYPGWEGYEAGAGCRGSGVRVKIEKALGAFQKVKTTGGEVRLEFVYHPMSFRLGLLASLFTLAALLGWGYGRSSGRSPWSSLRPPPPGP